MVSQVKREPPTVDREQAAGENNTRQFFIDSCRPGGFPAKDVGLY